MLTLLFIPPILAVAYILYKIHKSKFSKATVDDGDNEFDQLEEMSKRIDELTKQVENNQKDTQKSWVESLGENNVNHMD